MYSYLWRRNKFFYHHPFSEFYHHSIVDVLLCQRACARTWKYQKLSQVVTLMKLSRGKHVSVINEPARRCNGRAENQML